MATQHDTSTSTSTSTSEQQSGPLSTPRAVGGGSPASSFSSPLPHAHPLNGGSVVDTFEACAQTFITIDPASVFTTFSAKTCAELLPNLTDEQLNYEIQFNNDILGRNLDFKLTRHTTRKSKTDALTKTVINPIISSECDEIFYDCVNFSHITHELTRSIASAQKFIDELKIAGSHTSRDDPEEVFYDCFTDEFNLPEPVSFLSFNVGEGVAVPDVTDHVAFKSISGRKVAHFGSVPYSYSGIVHPAKDYPECPALDAVITRMQENLPIPFTKEEWSCLVTLYEDGKSSIPPHSDNEQSIVPGSDIYTVSLGATRSLIFQNTIGPVSEQSKHDLPHGSVHCMSRASQDSWEHSIPPTQSPDCGPRVSLTFRKLQPVVRPTIPPIKRPVQQPTSPPRPTDTPRPRPKRILMLADSIHISFPTRMFDINSIVCIKKRLPNFCLSDLHLFENEFAYTDLVFLSCGVNDMSRYGWSASKLFSYTRDLLTSYRTRFPKTKFIFNSVLLTNIKWLNMEIKEFNNLIFNFSLADSSNMWFFDSHHIATTLSSQGYQIIETGSRRANGVHITYDVTREIRGVISRCLKEWCGVNFRVLKEVWPLRPDFRHRLDSR